MMGAPPGERLQQLRLSRGLAQSELAKAIGLKNNSAISKLENGSTLMSDEALAAIAETLACTVDYLQRPGHDFLTTKPWLRAYADAPARTVESVGADNLLMMEFVLTQSLLRIPDTIPMFDGDLNDDHAIERFAEEVRSAAGVDPGGRVRNALRAAERLGCVVLPLSEELGRHLGMSQRIDGVPVIRVSRGGSEPGIGVPGDRQRFTVLHELGHLGLHSNLGPPDSTEEAKRLEKQAHRFSAAFLAPADPLLAHWENLGGRVTLSTLASLKAEFGIAIKALVTRFRHLGIIGDDKARSLYRQISSRGWATSEPIPVTAESAVWIDRAIQKAFPGDPEPLRAAAEAEGLGASYLEAWRNWEPTRMAEILQFPRS